MINVGEILLNLWNDSGFARLFAGFGNGGWQNLVMILIACRQWRGWNIPHSALVRRTLSTLTTFALTGSIWM